MHEPAMDAITKFLAAHSDTMVNAMGLATELDLFFTEVTEALETLVAEGTVTAHTGPSLFGATMLYRIAL